MKENFLPEYTPRKKNRKVLCEKRSKYVPATPEELVRQRVLHWLIEDVGWQRENITVEKNYEWVSRATKQRGRSDIELLDNDGKVLVVIECKREEVPLSESVDDQAIDYAQKARTEWIWTTNGISHGFMKKVKGKWVSCSELELLKISTKPPVTTLQIPESSRNKKALKKYWESFHDDQFLGGSLGADVDIDFILAAHRLFFGIDFLGSSSRRLPFSHLGVHMLESRGSAWHQFTTPGGSFYTRYADFMAATQGTVAKVSLGINLWHKGGLRLCIGVTTPERTRHSLELDTKKCVRDPDKKLWQIYCDGRNAKGENSDVMEAVREARADAWIEEDEKGKERIYLGDLPDMPDWKNSKKLLANLVHYGIIKSDYLSH